MLQCYNIYIKCHNLYNFDRMDHSERFKIQQNTMFKLWSPKVILWHLRCTFLKFHIFKVIFVWKTGERINLKPKISVYNTNLHKDAEKSFVRKKIMIIMIIKTIKRQPFFPWNTKILIAYLKWIVGNINLITVWHYISRKSTVFIPL